MKRHEIGGYLQLEDFSGHEYHRDLIAVNTARNAFVYIARALKIRKVFIPFFLCDSIRNVCIREQVDFEEYSIDAGFQPVLDCSLGQDEYLYVVNYYGQLAVGRIMQLKEQHRNIIIDNVQAFFQRPVEGVPTVYSCRKFFGVPDGAYAYVPSDVVLELSQDCSKDRMAHLLGRYEGSASEYYGAFKQNDRCFDDLPLMSMSRLTCNLLKGLDYQAIKERRERNWGILDHKLGALNEMPLACPIGPYMYPLYCRNGMRIKEELAGKGIYVPTLWPNVLGECPEGSIEYQYAADILPLPVDQRYGEEEMERMVYEIQHIGNSRG